MNTVICPWRLESNLKYFFQEVLYKACEQHTSNEIVKVIPKNLGLITEFGKHIRSRSRSRVLDPDLGITNE